MVGDADDPLDDALAECIERLEDAQELTDVTDRAIAEREAVEDVFVDAVATALVGGENFPVVRYSSPVGDVSHNYNRTVVKQLITDRVEQLRGEAGPRPFNEFIEERLETVYITRTTDANQGTTYTWDFGTFRVETRSGGDGRGHFHWSHFRDTVLEAGGPNVGRPPDYLASGDDWRDFIVPIIEDRGEARTIEGPRTRAVDRLENRITRATGYGTAEAALDYGGIWVVRETTEVPDWWGGFGPSAAESRDLSPETVRDVRVPEADIVQALNELEATRTGLYNELDARGHTLPGRRGVSQDEWVDGSKARFWVLSPSLAVPRVYEPDPRAAPRPDAPAAEAPTDTALAADGDGEADEYGSVGGSL